LDLWPVRLLLGIFVPAWLSVEQFSNLYLVECGSLGRSGYESQGEFVLAGMVAIIIGIHSLVVLPFTHRFHHYGKISLFLVIMTIIFIISGCASFPYTTNTPKQVYVDHVTYPSTQKAELKIRSADSVPLGDLMNNLNPSEWECNNFECTKSVAVANVPLPWINVTTDTFDSTINLRTVTFNISHPNTKYSTVYLDGGYVPVVGVSFVNNFPDVSESNWEQTWFWNSIGNDDELKPGSFWMETTGGIGGETWQFSIRLIGPKQTTLNICLNCRYAIDYNADSSALVLQTLSKLPDYVVLNPWGDFVSLKRICIDF